MTDTFGVPAGPIETPPAGFRPEGEQSVILQDTLRAAGVELGAQDKRIVDWLSGWEWSTVATIASWIHRANTSQKNRPVTGRPDARTALHVELMAGEDPDSPEYADANARVQRLIDDHRDQVLAEAADAVLRARVPEPIDSEMETNWALENLARTIRELPGHSATGGAQPPATLPRTTATGRGYLAKFAAAQDAGKPVHVYRDPSKPGSGVSRPALERLLADGLVQLGERERQHDGRPVLVTDLGRAVLAAHTTEA